MVNAITFDLGRSSMFVIPFRKCSNLLISVFMCDSSVFNLDVGEAGVRAQLVVILNVKYLVSIRNCLIFGL